MAHDRLRAQHRSLDSSIQTAPASDPDDGRRPPPPESSPPKPAEAKRRWAELPDEQHAVVTILACSRDPLDQQSIARRVWGFVEHETLLALTQLVHAQLVRATDVGFVLVRPRKR